MAHKQEFAFGLLIPALIGLLPGTARSAPPEIYLPGVVSGPVHEAAPAFTPDGQTVYFQRSNPAASVILVAHRISEDAWSEPRIAPFSGVWNDLEPAMAPDGSFMLFVSNRPTAAGGEPVSGFFNGKPQMGGNLWRMDRVADGWSAPARLPGTVNRSPNVFAPSIAGDGSVYFMDAAGENGRFRLFRSQYRDGDYQPAQPVAFSDGQYTDVDPAVAPDESFMIFGSSRAPAKSIDLFIVHREGAGWGVPIHLGDEVNSPLSDAEPRLSPDRQILYFSSNRVVPVDFPRDRDQARRDVERIESWDNGQYNVWKVPLAPWLGQDRSAPAGN